MDKLNIPSFNSLIPRERRIKSLQELYQYVKEHNVSTSSTIDSSNKDAIPSSGAVIDYVNLSLVNINNETFVDAAKGGTIFLKPNVYTRLLLSNRTSDITLNFQLGNAISNKQNLYEGSFDIDGDITTSGQKVTIKWPSNINWGTSDISLAVNTHYEFSIRKDGTAYYGIMHSWSLS